MRPHPGAAVTTPDACATALAACSLTQTAGSSPTAEQPAGAEDYDISRADLGLPATICGRFALGVLFERKGPLALKVSAERRGLRDVDVLDLVLELRRVGEKMLADQARNGAGLKAGTRVLVDLCLEENFGSLSDAGICTLCTSLGALSTILQPRILRMHANSITDVGAKAIAGLLSAVRWPVEEIHLSHNQVTAHGAADLILATLDASDAGRPRYPRSAKPGAGPEVHGRAVPLWLRMEFNLIELEALRNRLGHAALAAVCVVSSVTRGSGPFHCSVHHCRRCGSDGRVRLPAVHLPYIECQRMAGGRSLLARVRAVRSDAASADPPAPDQAGAGMRVEEPPALYLLLDTNVVLRMASTSDSATLTFVRVLEEAIIGRDVKLLLIETVRQQLEGLKDSAGSLPRPHHRAVRHFFGSQLLALGAANCLWYLATTGVEDLARAQSQRVEHPEGKVGGRRDMDGRIIDCGIVLSHQLGDDQNLVLLTDDTDLLARAICHGLPADSWRNLNARMASAEKGGDLPLNAADILQACSPPCREALEQVRRALRQYRSSALDASPTITSCIGPLPQSRRKADGASTGSTPARSRVLNPFQELQLAADLAREAIQAVGKTTAPELVHKLDAAATRWEALARSSSDHQRGTRMVL